MSSRIEQEGKLADNRKCNMNSHYEIGNLKTTESSACQSSSTFDDSPDSGTELLDENKRRTENTLAMQAISRQETGDFHRSEDETSDSARLLDSQYSRSNGEGCFENENYFQIEDMLQSRVQVEVGSTRHHENVDNPSQNLEKDENDCRIADAGKASNVRPQPEILLQPISLCAESSRSQPSSRKEHGTNPSSSVRSVKLTGTREQSRPTTEQDRAELGADPPGSVRFTKPPESTRQHPSATSELGGENRDIFETGGEHSRYHPARASRSGVEEIEHLPLEESPEPQIVISPSLSDEPPANLCKLAGALFWRWICCLKQRTCRQFAKAPFLYLFSTLIIIIGINVWDRAKSDQDVPLAVVGSFGTFMVITLIFERGQFSHVIGKWSSCMPECRRGCGNADPCIPWCCCCCRSPEPPVVRHSQYRHLEEDGAFRHEIADVSRLDPKDCPQMKMVEQRESEHADSPEYPPEVSQVNADVHVGKQDGEKLGAARKHLGKVAAQKTKPPKIRSDRSRSRIRKTFRADIHAADLEMSELSPPQLSPIRETTLEDGMQNGEAEIDKAGCRTTEERTSSKNLEDFDNNELSKTTTNSPELPGGVFKKFSDCSPTFPRFADTRQTDSFSGYHRAAGGRSTPPDDEMFPVDEIEVPDAGEFLCEHYGQSVACSCAALLMMPKENEKR